MHEPNAVPSPGAVQRPPRATVSPGRGGSVALMLMVGAASGVAFVALIRAPLPEEAVLASAAHVARAAVPVR
jgi:H+/Cl- antiporter ClcA